MCKNYGKLKEGSEGEGEGEAGAAWGFLWFGWKEEDEVDLEKKCGVGRPFHGGE